MTSRNQGKYIGQVNCNQVDTNWVQLKHNLIKLEQLLRNDYNEHLRCKWISGHASNKAQSKN